MNKIIFHSNRVYCKKDDGRQPESTAKSVPDWFQKADLYFKNPQTGEDYVDQTGYKHPTYKACPAILDILTAGYVLRTPCDLTFYEEDGRLKVKTEDGYTDFCDVRPAMEGFPVPAGHRAEHFHWWANWAPELPEGYSAIYTAPLNRFDLPFTSPAGIIDNDKFSIPGLIPFFVREDFTGVIPAGTPYMQIIPFKRDDWEAEYVIHNQKEVMARHKYTVDTFRTKEGGVYKKSFWNRRKYK